MQAGISWIVLVLMSLNLSPQDPPKLQAGSFWTYRVEGEGNLTMSIVEASPSDAGTVLKVMVSSAAQVAIPVQVVVAGDRKSIKASVDVGSRLYSSRVGMGKIETLDLAMPELKVGSRIVLPEARIATITDVRPEPTTTAAGSFPNAVRISAAREGAPQTTVWIAPGVGLLAAGSEGNRELELTNYGPGAAGAVSAKRITIELKDAPVVDTILELVKDEPVSIAFRDIPPDLRVTATIRDASPEEAVMLLCAAAGLEWEDVGRESGVIRMPSSVTVGGARVPVVGAMSVGSRDLPTTGPVTISAPGLAISTSTQAPWVAPGLPRLTFEGDDKLVDLEVKDAPIREAMAKLSAASGYLIDVAEPVSNDLKVTARIYRMPIGDVLSMIVEQAQLTYSVSYAKRELDKQRYEGGLITADEYEASRGKPEIHIVPKPELTVTGPATIADLRSFLNLPAPSKWTAPQLGATCPKCGCKGLASDWRFCPECGGKLPHVAKPSGKAK